MIESIKHYYSLFARYAGYLAPVALLVLRLGWGWELIESGYGHLTHIQQTTDYFTSLHIPFPKANVIISASMELIGGVLLIIGLCARLISIPLIFNFIVAIVTANHDNVVNIFRQDPKNIVDDTAYPFLITSIIILAFGPGLLSIDGLLKATAFKPRVEHRGFSPEMETK